MTVDRELLSRWAEQADETAFRALVERYAGLVHGVAARRVNGNEALAEEIGQNVFTMLARKAASLAGHTSLASWLHRAAVLESAHLLRREAVHARKVAAFAQHADAMISALDSSTSNLLPGLDEALARLSESDRSLLLQRYFRGLSHREIGEAAGKNEPAVRKRLERALSRLASQLSRSGTAVTVLAVTGALQASLSHAAPAGYRTTVGASALSAAPALSSVQILLHTLKIMTFGKTFPLAAAAILLLLSFGGSYLAGFQHSQTDTPARKNTASTLPPGGAAAAPARVSTGAISRDPSEADSRTRVRSLLTRISKGIRVHIKSRSVELPMDNPLEPGGIDGMRAMGEFDDADLEVAWQLLPEFRDKPDYYEGLALFLAGIRTEKEPPQDVVAALLKEDYRINGGPPLCAIHEVVGAWFNSDPRAAWAWMRDAVAKGDYIFDVRKPCGADYVGEWLAKDPSAALAALAPLPPEWNTFTLKALRDALEHTAGRKALWPELQKADDRTALQLAECQPKPTNWARKELLPWLLTRPWGNGVTPARITHAWTWQDGQLDEARFGMLCESVGRLPSNEANEAVLHSVREVLADAGPESQSRILEHLVKDPAQRKRVREAL